MEAHPRILIVDDQELNIHVLQRILRDAGYSHIRSTTDPCAAVALFVEYQPDLVLLDLQMPVLDGFGVLERMVELLPADGYLPILMLTADDRVESKQRALSSGAMDFLAKPFAPVEVLLRVRNLLQTRRLHVMLLSQNEQLDGKVRERTRELEEAQIEIVERLATAAEFRDDDTGRHTQRVGELAVRIAHAAGFSDRDLDVLRRAAPLHDVGKIGVPDGLLLKPGALTSAEREQMKMHTVMGAQILSGGRSDLLRMSERIALSHHEQWDGSGYPYGLAGDAIPIEARIVAIADVFDALTHDRPYRKAWPLDAVIAEIRRGRGGHFDPQLVDAFLGCRPERAAPTPSRGIRRTHQTTSRVPT
jgi:putative two-component system response regulator